MLFEYIERIRQKPREARKTYVLVFSLIITGFIVVIWLVTLWGMSNRTQDDTFVAGVEEKVEKDSSALFDAANSFLEKAGFRDADSEDAPTAVEKYDVVDEIPQDVYKENIWGDFIESETSASVPTPSSTSTEFIEEAIVGSQEESLVPLVPKTAQ